MRVCIVEACWIPEETCPRCGEVIRLNAARRPLTHVEHEASETDPKVFVVIDAGGWMLHRCVVVGDEK